MMVTESEATAGKFCPMTMSGDTDHTDQRCLGSACMAWKLTGTIKVVGPMVDCPECKGSEAGCDFCDFTGHTGQTEPIGYCGLAGRG